MLVFIQTKKGALSHIVPFEIYTHDKQIFRLMLDQTSPLLVQLNQIPHSLGRSFVLTTALAKGRPLSSCISFYQRAAARCLSHSMLKKRDLKNYKVSKYILAEYHLVQCSGELTLQAYLIFVNHVFRDYFIAYCCQITVGRLSK